MDEKEFRARTDRLEKIAKVLDKLPPEIRSEAFALLKSYVTDHSVTPKPKSTSAPKDTTPADVRSEDELFGVHDHDKPADNVRLIAASFYQEFGTEPFSVDEVDATAERVGITVPARVDMTLLSAKEKGKKLFARAGRGRFKPTVHGEAHLRRQYSVRKGTKKRPGEPE